MKKRFRLSALGLAFAASTAVISPGPGTAGTLEWKGITTGLSGGTDQNWNTNTTANWWNGAATVNWPALGGTDDDAVFGGTAGTVILAGTVTANDLTFTTTGYILSGASTLTLNGTTPTITLGTGISATIGNNTATVLDGTAGLTKAGAGILTLNGTTTNTFTGGLKVNGGTLSLDFSNFGGSAPFNNLVAGTNALTLGGGTLSMLGENSTGVSAQTFTGANINSGLSRILVTNGSGGTSANLTLGTLSRAEAGGTLNLSLGTAAMAATLSNVEKIFVSGATNRWLGMWAFSGDPTTANARWVYVDATGQLRVNNGAAAGTNMVSVTSESSIYTVSAGTNTLAGSRQAQGIQVVSSTPGTVAIGANTLTTSGILNITAGGTWNFTRTGSGGITVGIENELVIAGGGNVTISAPITDKAASNSNVTYAGGATLTLNTAASTYSGQTTVNSGTMVIGTGGEVNTSSGIRINGGKFVQSNTATAVTPTVSLIGGTAGGTIDGTGTINTVNVSDLTANKITNGNGTTTALTIGSLTLSGDGTIDIRTGGSAGLTVTGALTTTPANGTVTVNVTSAPTWTSGNTYNLISYGTFGGSISDFTKGTIAGLGARQTSNLVINASNIALSIGGDKALWTGAANGNWTITPIGTPFNWKTQTGLADTEFLVGDDVVFGNTPGATTIDINHANVSPTTVEFSNTTNDYTITSTGGFGISAGSLTKTGSSTVTLTTANTYTGATTINAGTLKVSGGAAIANTGLVTLGNFAGATFQLVGSETVGALNGGGATGGAVSIDAGQTLTLSSGTQTYAGTVSGSGTLTNAGATQTINGVVSNTGGVNASSGVITLGSSSNSYTGITTVSSGAGLVVSANGALGSTGTGNGTTIVGTGSAAISGALGFAGGVNYTTTETISGSGVGNTSANGVFASVQRGFVQAVSGNNSFAGNIEINAAGISRIGTQTGAQLTLAGAITMAPGVTGVQLLFRSGDNNGDYITLSNTGNNWDLDTYVYSGGSTGNSGLRLGINNGLPAGVSITGGTSSVAATTFDMAGFNQTLNGLVSNGQLKLINSNNAQQSTLTLNLTADKGTGSTQILDGAGTLRLVKQGNFTQTFSATNNYSGTTTIEAGRILFGTVLSLYNGNSANWTKENIIVNSGATLGLRVGGGGQFTTSDVATIVGNITTGINNNGLQSGSLLDLEVNATTTYSTVLADSTGTGSGSLGLVKTGGSDLTLDQNNSFTGGVALNDGYLNAGHNSAFGAGTVTIGTGAERMAIQNGINIGNDIVINGGGTAFNGIIQNFNAAAGENATVSGDITINANAGSGGHFASVGTGSTLTLTGTITSSIKVQQRAGTVIYSGGGSYTDFGITGTAQLGANNGLATNTVADLGVAGNGTLDLGGYNQSLVGITKNSNAATIGNSSTTADSTLSLTGTSNYAGVIQNSLGSGTRKTHLTINGSGQTFTLTGSANTYGGNTTINAGGTLALGAAGALSSASTVVLNGGTLLAGGFSNTGASLSLSAATGSKIDLNGTSVLTFSGIDAPSFTSNTLAVWNWSGTLGGGGTERLMVPAGSLDATQLGNISFVDPAGLGAGSYGATLLGTGELVPVPEPGALAAAAVLAAAAFGPRRRRR